MNGSPGDRRMSVGEATRQRLNNLRHAILHLHKVLLEIERIDYEQLHGRVTPGELLKLLVQNGQFAWLRAVSEIIVRIDEMLEDEEAAEEDARQLFGQAGALLVPAEGGTGFARHYFLALQRDRAAALAHREARKVLADPAAEP
jgi:hypothetical protein